MAINSFLEEYDLSGKTIIPFTFHGGSGWADSREKITALEPKAVVSEPRNYIESETVLEILKSL